MGAKCNVMDKGACCGSLRIDEAVGTPPRTISASGSSARRPAAARRASAVELKRSPRPFEATPAREGLSTDADNGGTAGNEAAGDAVPKKSTILKSAIAKVRSTVNISLEERREFRRFLKPHFRTPGEAFDAFADGATSIDRERFVRKVEAMHYPGNPEKVFSSLCDGEGFITRKTFQQSLKAACNEATFSDVVKLAVEVQKATKKVCVVEPELSERAWAIAPELAAPALESPGRQARARRGSRGR